MSSFSYRAIVRDNLFNHLYCLEFPENGAWRLLCDDQEQALANEPRMLREGGTTKTTLASGDQLVIPQQLFTVVTPKSPTINGRPLDLVEWWLGGEHKLNGHPV